MFKQSFASIRPVGLNVATIKRGLRTSPKWPNRTSPQCGKCSSKYEYLKESAKENAKCDFLFVKCALIAYIFHLGYSAFADTLKLESILHKHEKQDVTKVEESWF